MILAPQGLDYIVAFLGAMQAGLIAVPLSVPLGGASDERVSSVLRDASPSVILTTSPVAGNVAEYVESQSGASAPSVVEVDLLDLDSRQDPRAGCENQPSTAYLQYTSGSTRQPAGVMMSHRNLLANFEQMTSDYFADYGKCSPAGHHCCVVAAVLSRHGFVSGNLRADSDGNSRCAHEPGGVPAAAGPVDAIAGKQ